MFIFYSLFYAIHFIFHKMSIKQASCRFNCLQNLSGCTRWLEHVNLLLPSEQLPSAVINREKQPALQQMANTMQLHKTYANVQMLTVAKIQQDKTRNFVRSVDDLDSDLNSVFYLQV